jgi:hypothetical protein
VLRVPAASKRKMAYTRVFTMVNIHIVVEDTRLSKPIIDKIKQLKRYVLCHNSVHDRRYVESEGLLTQLWHLYNRQETSKCQEFDTSVSKIFGPCEIRPIYERYWGKVLEETGDAEDYVVIVRNDADNALSSATCHFISQSRLNVLIIGEQPWHKTVRLAAAIDPFHEDDPEQEADNIIWHHLQQLKLTFKGCFWQLIHAIYIPAIAIDHKKVISEIHREGVSFFCKTHRCSLDQLKYLYGRPEESIAQYIKQDNIDVLIVGSRKHGYIDKWLNGSTVEVLVQLDHIDILIARGKG